MASCKELVRRIRQKNYEYGQSLSGCESVQETETATRLFVTCIVSLGVPDHIVKFERDIEPQDYEEQKDPVGESEASLLKLLREFKQTVFTEKQKSSAELLKAMAFKAQLEEMWTKFNMQLATNEATLKELEA
jgi:hypothetical protein